MDDGRRFLRYVAPGLLFTVETWLLVAARDFSEAVNAFAALLRDTGFGTLASLVVLSGGLGYLFSMTHHVLHWLIWIPFGVARSAKPAIEAAVGRGHLVLVDLNGRPLQPNYQVGHHQAWQILVALWHERVESVDRMKGADVRATSLGDIMHNAGTALIGFAAAFVVALSVPGFGSVLPPIASVFWLSAAVLLSVHIISYVATSRVSQGVVDIIFADALRAEAASEVAHALVPVSDRESRKNTQAMSSGSDA